MQIKELIYYGIKMLQDNKIEDTNIKAKLLLSHILNIEKNDLLIYGEKEVEEDKENKYLEKIKDIIDGKPLQYITNKQEFMGNIFYVNENVLIPQSDTEILVEEVLEYINDLSKMKKIKDDENNNKLEILDLCTGSGAIAVSIAKYQKEKVIVYASDISKRAIEIAKENAKRNEAEVNYILSDMFENISNKKFDIIVSNPPYIQRNVIKTLSKEVQSEPHLALDGGEDGLDFYRVISKKANQYLKKDGAIFLEIGYDQKDDVIGLFNRKKEYIKIKSKKDLAGNDRVIIIKK